MFTKNWAYVSEDSDENAPKFQVNFRRKKTVFLKFLWNCISMKNGREQTFLLIEYIFENLLQAQNKSVGCSIASINKEISIIKQGSVIRSVTLKVNSNNMVYVRMILYSSHSLPMDSSIQIEKFPFSLCLISQLKNTLCLKHPVYLLRLPCHLYLVVNFILLKQQLITFC